MGNEKFDDSDDQFSGTGWHTLDKRPNTNATEIPTLKALESADIPVQQHALNDDTLNSSQVPPSISEEILRSYLPSALGEQPEQPLETARNESQHQLAAHIEEWDTLITGDTQDQLGSPMPESPFKSIDNHETALAFSFKNGSVAYATHRMRAPETVKNKLPIVFVSGICNGPSSLQNFEDHFLRECHIVSHLDWDKQNNPDITEMTIEKYAEALHSEIRAIKMLVGLEKVALVGHSMGTAIINKYIQMFGEDDIELVAMLAPVPATGALIPTLKMIAQKGGLKTLLKTIWTGAFKGEGMTAFLENKELVKKIFYREGFPPELFEEAYKLLGNDSFWAYALDMIGKYPFIGQTKITRPLFIASGTEDFISPPKGHARIAKRAKNPDAATHEYEGMGHALGLEPDFEEVARDLSAFIQHHSPLANGLLLADQA